MAVKKGKVVARAYAIKVGTKEYAVCEEAAASAQVAELLGKEVEVLMSGPSIVAIRPVVSGRVGPHRGPVLCYVPAENLLKKVGPEVKKAATEVMLRDAEAGATLAKWLGK